MRIQIKTNPNVVTVHFDYLSKLVGTIHKWLGKNQLHDKISLYSFSWLYGSVRQGQGLSFPNGATFFIGFYEEEYGKQLIRSILDDPEMFCGMIVQDVVLIETLDFSDQMIFRVASPVLVKRWIDAEKRTEKHYIYDDAETEELMRETLLRKMREAGLVEDETLQIRFDLSDSSKKTKLVKYRDIKSRANMCRLIIEGKPETKEFAWNVGIGSSTGIGFGSLW